MGNLVYGLTLLLLVGITFNVISDKDRQIDKLNQQVSDINDDHKADLHKRCMDAVDRACNYADCAIMPIEQIQDEVCKYLERQE